MNKPNCPMRNKHRTTPTTTPNQKPKLENVGFPTDDHVITPKQREVPSPAAAIAASGIYNRYPGFDSTIDAISSGQSPSVQEELRAGKRRPFGAPMATKIDDDMTVFKRHEQLLLAIAFVLWSGTCVLFGALL